MSSKPLVIVTRKLPDAIETRMMELFNVRLNTEDTADMTMALILAVARRLSEGERLMRGGKWQGWSPMGMLGHRIHGKRLGIVGMGRIRSAGALAVPRLLASSVS